MAIPATNLITKSKDLVEICKGQSDNVSLQLVLNRVEPMVTEFEEKYKLVEQLEVQYHREVGEKNAALEEFDALMPQAYTFAVEFLPGFDETNLRIENPLDEKIVSAENLLEVLLSHVDTIPESQQIADKLDDTLKNLAKEASETETAHREYSNAVAEKRSAWAQLEFYFRQGRRVVRKFFGNDSPEYGKLQGE